MMSFANGSSTSGPYLPTTAAINANTPKGANAMMPVIILYMTSAKELKKTPTGSATLPARDMEAPTNRANTMMGSIWAFTIASMGLVGKMATIVSSQLAV